MLLNIHVWLCFKMYKTKSKTTEVRDKQITMNQFQKLKTEKKTHTCKCTCVRAHTHAHTHTHTHIPVKLERYYEIFDSAAISRTDISVAASAFLSSEQIIFTITDHIRRHKIINVKGWSLCQH